MIEIKNLTKIYDKSKEPVKALNNISLVLPDKGLVFVLGKSGSGKSTFLNMLGGLDGVTSGDILINGMSIVHLKDSDFEKLRNDYIGIIYQNFNLFPNETVKENIMTTSLISNKNITGEDVTKICSELDLGTKENVLVKNLSGGQKQRVAIARALIKDPELILADEPTGNLDSKTTKVIFDILKNISKDKLVVVISHDIASAEKYADRIIYLSDGKIVEDVKRNEHYKKSDSNSIILPKDCEYTDEQIVEINKSLEKHNLRVDKPVSKFIPHNEVITSTKESLKLSKSKGKSKLSFGVANKFFKSTKASFIITLILLTFIIGILSLAQTFAQFNGADAVARLAEDYQSKNFILNRAYSYYDDPSDLNRNYHISISDEDKQAFINAGYSGKIYSVYNTPVITNNTNLNNEYGVVTKQAALYKGNYSMTALGTVVCDYDYLTYLFGDIKVLAGSLYGLESNSKLIVTDYVADSILKFDKDLKKNIYISQDRNDPYQKITNTLLWNRYQIGAIIDTGYKERFKELLDKIERLQKESQNSKQIAAEIYQSKEFTQFYDELNSSLNFTYSVNPNFYESYISETQGLAIWLRNCTLINESEKVEQSYNCNAYTYYNSELDENTMMMNINLYNKLFNKTVTLNDRADFEEKEIVLSNYAIDQDSRDTPKTKLTLKIVDVTNDVFGGFGVVDKASYEKLADDAIFEYALIFDNVEQSFLINETAQENFFYTTLNAFDAMFNICNIIEIFSSVFIFFVVALLFIEFIMIVSHNLRTIKKNQYRIGVYKGIGCPSSVFSWACIFNTITLVVSTFITSILFVFVSSSLINSILVKKFEEFIKSKVIADFTFVGFSATNLILYMTLVLVVGGISILVPILKLRKLKPNLIINKAE